MSPAKPLLLFSPAKTPQIGWYTAAIILCHLANTLMMYLVANIFDPKCWVGDGQG